MRGYRLGLGVLLSLAACGPASASAPHPVVLELFTSQGCSSCPPADALLSDLAGQPGILALSYHITYWNRLGWEDPLSFEAATQRQYAYGAAMGRSNVYTPEMVVQGGADASGADRDAIKSAVEASAAAESWIPVTLQKKDGRLHIAAQAPGGLKAEIILIGYQKHSENDIPRGENAGTRGRHRNSVVSIQSLGDWAGGALDLDQPVPPGDGTAVLVQTPGHGAILGAGWLGE